MLRDVSFYGSSVFAWTLQSSVVVLKLLLNCITKWQFLRCWNACMKQPYVSVNDPQGCSGLLFLVQGASGRPTLQGSTVAHTDKEMAS
jgi:hypothetical protein